MAKKSRSKARTNHSKPFTILGDTLESAAETFEEATVNANSSARRAAQATKRALATGVFNTFYGISFGVVYAGVFLTELLPEGNSVRRALSDGAESALKSREKSRLAAQSRKKAAKPEKVTENSEDAPVKPKRSRPKVASRVRKAVESRADEFDTAVAEAEAVG